MKARLHHGDCMDLLRSLPDSSIESVVTDPPYGLGKPPPPDKVLAAWLAGERAEVKGGGFMGKDWDAFVPGPKIWREVLRVVKPGGYAIVFAGTRTLDWMTMACRLAGWNVRDTGVYCYWSGFPKSLSVFKATGEDPRWEGWGTALKPAWEPWIVLRKPLEGTVAANVLKWGTGAVNVDGCRFKPGDPMWPGPQVAAKKGWKGDAGFTGSHRGGTGLSKDGDDGRWPANLVHVAKPSRSERERGLDRIPAATSAAVEHHGEGSKGLDSPRAGAGRTVGELKNNHPTVKPVRLMRWLVRLTTPPGGTVLDPFMGSGTTGAAACGQGFGFIGADLDARYVAISHERIRHSAPGVTIDTPDQAVDILGTASAPTFWDLGGEE